MEYLERIDCSSVSLKKRVLDISKSFEEEFLCKPQLISEAPGRVNIIGEHIDYMGFGVLPMAIGRTTLIAISSKPANCLKVIVSNTCKKFETIQMSFPKPEEDLKNLRLTDRHHWTNYILCGLKGLVMDECEEIEIPKKEFMLLVDGDVPIGKGLSSSSSVNCAASISFMDRFGLKFSKHKLSSFTQVVERFIGMMGGGMDQAISIFGEKGFAKFVEFCPEIKVSSVQLKDRYCFVVADSMVESNKNETASKYYNMRVVECRLGSAILGKKMNLKGWNKIKTLWQLQQDGGELSLEDMEKLCIEHLPSKETQTIQEISDLLEMSVEELRKIFLFNHQAGIEIKLMNEDNFKLRNRCLHVFSEARRVLKFIETSKKLFSSSSEDEESVFSELGKLMDESHFSNRDLYEASCEELEKLTKLCRSHGALGSRFTGAGWGGCCISLVSSDKADEFIETIWKEYYDCKKVSGERKDFIFRSYPENGATFYDNM